MHRKINASIIILNFNGRTWLTECLHSLARLDYPKDSFEVILGDNASTDDSVEYTQAHFPWVKVVRLDKNYGYCKGNNLTAQQAAGEYLIFLNNDTFVDPAWLSHLVQRASSDSTIVSCTPKIFIPYLKNGKILQAAGGIILPSGGGFTEGWLDEDAPKYNIPKYTGFGPGSGVLVQKRFFMEIGGFDEYYFHGIEEMDLGYRAWMLGYKVFYEPTAIMSHYMGKTAYRSEGVTPTIEFLMTRNGLYFILKNFQFTTMLWAFTLFHCKAAYKIFYALRKKNHTIPMAIIKGYFLFLKDLLRILKIRRATQASRRVSDKELFKKTVLVNTREFIRIYKTANQNFKKYSDDSFYDTKDAVKIKVEKNGEFTFVAP